jgi:phosphate transport system substrate-binding protein
MTIRAWLPVGSITVLVIGGCQGQAPDPRVDDTPTSGHVRLIADEDLRSIVEAERVVFEALYKKAHLDITYLPERELLRSMGSDSIRCSITYALPGADQDTALARRRISARKVPFFIDGIAVVVHKDRAIHMVDVPALRQCLSGSATVWGVLEHSTSTDPVRALFAGSGSGVARSLIDSLQLTTLNAQALGHVQEVMDRVANDPQALGFVPFNAIGDLDDPAVRAMRERVKLLAISDARNAVGVLPSQSTLADGQYPLRRTAYLVLTEGKSGLGTGFVSFVANHKGQRIILKRGVAPIKVPGREVEIVQP